MNAPSPRPGWAARARLPEFPWDRLAPYAETARRHPGGIVDLSIGTPVDPTPQVVQDALCAAADAPGYPLTVGTTALREALVTWIGRRLGATVGVHQVLPSIGSKELVSLLPSLLGLEPGTKVLIPQLAYPTYDAGVRLAGCVPVPTDDPTAEDPDGVGMVWLNSPSNPTGEVLDADRLHAVVEWGRRHGVLVVGDECYYELGWEAESVSVLDPRVCGDDADGVLALHSLSKRSNLAGYRAGFVAGDPAAIAVLTEARKHLGLLTPAPVQAALVAALADDAHVAEQKARYAARRQTLLPAVKDAGFSVEHSAAGLYLWCTRDEACWETVAALAEVGVLAAPGEFYGEAGARHVRMALTATDERIAAAAERLVALGVSRTSEPSYRWVVLGAGVVAQAASAAVLQGLPGMAPQLRDEYGLSLTGLGVLLTSVTVGLLSTLVLWGVLADRYGERRVMTVGLLLAVTALVGASETTTVLPLMACLVVAGAAGSSVNAASGRAVLGWFAPAERGFAMGVRQTALPLGAGIGAAVLPPLAAARGLDAAFLLLAGGCLLGATVVALLVREAPRQPQREPGGLSPARDPRIRRMGAVSALLVVPQFAVVAFLVVYLVDEHAVPVAAAALLLAAVQLGGGAGRIVAGRWSDRLGLRVVPLRRLAMAIASLFVLLTLLEALEVRAAVPLLLLTGVVAISWNGLAFTAVGELAGPGRAGTALGLQNTAVAFGAALTAPVLGAVVDRSDWAVGFAVAASCAVLAAVLLRGLAGGERQAAGAPIG